jgi:hypothetical protein
MVSSHDVTLLDVFQAVREVAENEHETLATMVHLLTSGQVRLSDEAIRAMKALVATMNAAADGRELIRPPRLPWDLGWMALACGTTG